MQNIRHRRFILFYFVAFYIIAILPIVFVAGVTWMSSFPGLEIQCVFHKLGSPYLYARWGLFHLSSGDDLLLFFNTFSSMSWISAGRDTEAPFHHDGRVRERFSSQSDQSDGKGIWYSASPASLSWGTDRCHRHGRYGFCLTWGVRVAARSDDGLCDQVKRGWMKCLSICQVRTGNISDFCSGVWEYGDRCTVNLTFLTSASLGNKRALRSRGLSRHFQPISTNWVTYLPTSLDTAGALFGLFDLWTSEYRLVPLIRKDGGPCLSCTEAGRKERTVFQLL